MKSFIIVVVLFLFSASLMSSENAGALLKRPYMLVTGEQIDGLRSLADVRRDIQKGRSTKLWKELLEKVDQELTEPLIAAGDRNRSYAFVAQTCSRITDTAFVALITDDQKYAQGALAQIEVLFDKKAWPEWLDKAHLQAGLITDLRHGQFARALGQAYDWLYPLLTLKERERLVEGLDRCAIQPFKASVAANEKWIHAQSNWKTCIIGGYGILGMALGDDHPDAKWLQEFTRPLMDKYMEVFGPNGEFNECPPYASSTRYVVDYYLAQFYAGGGQGQALQLKQLGDFSHWFLYCILPPKRVITFGDGNAGSPPNISHFGAIAAALRDPVIQWTYLQYVDFSQPDTRKRAQELLFYDPTLKPRHPTGNLRLGRSFPAQSGIVTSRSSWNPENPISIIYSKARTEDVHRHADWGQVCIDGFGERLITDLGSPPVYPLSGKRFYYNYQQSAHNVLAFGDDEMDVIWRVRRQGRTVWSEFDDTRGGAWTFDLSAVYAKDRKVRRHVIHLLPRITVVLDEATSPNPERIRLRWHTSAPAKLDSDGRFTFEQKGVTLAASVTSLAGEAKIRTGRHEYLPPYDNDRLGKPYPHRNEPYIETQVRSNHFRTISIFCVTGPDESSHSWNHDDNGWDIQTPEGTVQVRLTQDELSAQTTNGSHAWRIDLKRTDKSDASTMK